MHCWCSGTFCLNTSFRNAVPGCSEHLPRSLGTLAENGACRKNLRKKTKLHVPAASAGSVGPTALKRTPASIMPKFSIVVATRDDDWGGNEKHAGRNQPAVDWGMRRRAGVALAHMLGAADEVVLVDFNSPSQPLLASLPQPIQQHPRLRSVVVDGAACAQLRANQSCGSDFFETHARNVGLREATGDVIASSSIDVLTPPRPVLDALMAAMASSAHAYVLPRRDDMSWHSRASLCAMSPSPSSNQPSFGGAPALTLEGQFARDNTTACALRELRAAGVGPWNASTSLANLSVPSQPQRALRSISLIDNVGDFQMASRELWSRTGFSEALEGRNYADSTLVAAWLNAGATVSVPSGAWVLHLSHTHPHRKRAPRQYAATRWNAMPHFRLEVQGGDTQRTGSATDKSAMAVLVEAAGLPLVAPPSHRARAVMAPRE